MIVVRNLENAIPESAVPSLGDDALNGILSDVTASARNHWIRLAEQDDSVYRADYINGIQPAVAESATRHVVALVGDVPHLLEDGAPRLDMRTTLLGSNVPTVPMGERGKHQNKKGGYFRAIPFRHTGVSSGKTVGQSMGSAYSGHQAIADSKKLGRAIYRAAKSLEATKSDPYGKTKWGGRLDTSKIRGGLKQGVGSVPLLKSHHKSDIYQGMVRQEKTYEKATQSQYVTFRTISTSVQDGSWWRKPIQARRYANKVGVFVSKVLPDAISAFVEAQK
jgi:hypothetical protein